MSPYIYRFTHLIGIDAIPVSLRSWGFSVCLLMTGLALGITYLDFQSFADLDFTQIFLQVIVAAALWKQLRSHRRTMMVPWHTILPSYNWFSKSRKSGQRSGTRKANALSSGYTVYRLYIYVNLLLLHQLLFWKLQFRYWGYFFSRQAGAGFPALSIY